MGLIFCNCYKIQRVIQKSTQYFAVKKSTRYFATCTKIDPIYFAVKNRVDIFKVVQKSTWYFAVKNIESVFYLKIDRSKVCIILKQTAHHISEALHKCYQNFPTFMKNPYFSIFLIVVVVILIILVWKLYSQIKTRYIRIHYWIIFKIFNRV